MTDLVDRLRQGAGEFWAHRYEADALLIDAAAEIERLRRAEHSALTLLRELTGVRVHYGDVVTALKAEIERLRAEIKALKALIDGEDWR